jgi:hypothetical protein
VNEREAELFLLDQIPMTLRLPVPTTLENCYNAAEAVIRDEPILQTPSARANRGRMISWAVERGFEKLVEGGQWPFDKRWQAYSHPTGRYLEIGTSHAVVTISQVANPRRQPRDVRFRENLRLCHSYRYLCRILTTTVRLSVFPTFCSFTVTTPPRARVDDVGRGSAPRVSL